jgi:predicted transposase YbfD/YdcC
MMRQGEVAPMNDPLIEMLSCVTDARREQAKSYGLANILLFCILGFLCGAKSYATLCSFIDERFALLQAAFPSKMKRAPVPSTLWRIIGLVDGGTLEAVFRRHATVQHAALGGGPAEVVAHDGKSLTGSYDTASDTRMSQLLRAFAVGTKIILGHVAIMLKSNEIPAMQALVSELGLAGVLCTADAMHCQIKTIEAVKVSGGEALLQVKGNQPSLEAAFEALPAGHEPVDCHEETGKIRRNRREKRVVEVFRAGRILDLPEWQTHAVAAVRVTRTVLRQDVALGWKWRCTREVAWYASTAEANSAAYYAAATRGHWGVENQVHYVLDVSMHEDASRVRKSPTTLSILRSFALNILRFNKVNNVADALWRNAMNFDRILAYSGM